MGIFGFKNKYDVEPKEKDLETLVTRSSVDVIKLNAKVVVPENYFFIIGKKGKVYDKFEAGEYFLNYTLLPQMCRKFGIDKVKNGESQDKIPADLYFVSRELRAGQFKTYRKVEMGTKAYGFFSAHVYGMYSYRVSDVKEFMQSLLNEYDYVKTGEAEDIVEAWVNEVVVSELEKQNFILDDVVKNSPIIAESLKLRVSKLFAIAGLELVSFEITKYKLPNKYQEESNKNIKDQKEKRNNQTAGVLSVDNMDSAEGATGKGVCADRMVSQGEVIKEEKHENGLEEDQNEAKRLLEEFGIGGMGNGEPEDINNSDGMGILNMTTETDSVKDENQEIINEEYVPFGNFVIEEAEDINKEKAKNSKEAKTFVDLSLNELYTNDAKNTKRCLSCGAENSLHARECSLCGELLDQD